MFSSISKVKWDELQQAHGKATHVPSALSDLISGDSQKEEDAYWKLDNHVVLQGDLYESAFHILPFLYEILGSEVTNGRERVYDLLFEIANGYEAQEVSCQLNGEILSLTDACRKSIVQQKDLFFKEVFDTSSRYRSKALELLSSFDEVKNDVIEKLSSIKSTEQDKSFESELSEIIEALKSEM
ncbi:hypothetical protein SG34_006295 [Thalassomonas viridans]|uniref:Uncharacterized protein n=1 Tax=Thalassomonas viridans TaxID=137584 RepID=A0AAF0CAH5_9GAMM|nr:hypothetical protein [Thalassomonas viridans]WDE06526.1 hypothetical protein SG34_006295 [Thalassomonas viridans]